MRRRVVNGVLNRIVKKVQDPTSRPKLRGGTDHERKRKASKKRRRS